MKPDTRFVVAVLALCGALSLVIALLWQFRPPTELVVYTCKSTPPPVPPVQMHEPKLPSCLNETFTIVNSEIPAALLVTVTGCLGAMAAILALQHAPKFSLPMPLRRLSFLVGLALAVIFVWSAGAWYGQFIQGGPLGQGGGWLVTYARHLIGLTGSPSSDAVSYVFIFSAGALFISRLDGRSVSSAVTSVLGWFVLPSVLVSMSAIMLFDYVQFRTEQFSGFVLQHFFPLLYGVPIIVSNGDAFFAAILLSFLLSLRMDIGRF